MNKRRYYVLVTSVKFSCSCYWQRMCCFYLKITRYWQKTCCCYIKNKKRNCPEKCTFNKLLYDINGFLNIIIRNWTKNDFESGNFQTLKVVILKVVQTLHLVILYVKIAPLHFILFCITIFIFQNATQTFLLLQIYCSKHIMSPMY